MAYPRGSGRNVPGLGWCRYNERGYLRVSSGPHQHRYAHRVVWELLAGGPLPAGHEVHHMGPKDCCCPHNLVALDARLHVPHVIRDPYTGEFLSADQWRRRYA
jgi:hypothetical protein